MLTFVIPVKSEKVSSDWSQFCRLFERTLMSVCNQTDANFKVVVVCHELPPVGFKHNNIYYIHADFEPPVPRPSETKESITKRREIDKGEKIKLGVAYAKENFNTDYIMTVDSDDFISNRLAAYVNTSGNDVNGWHIKRGYIYLEGKNHLFLTRKFSDLCGSSIIVKPDLIEHFFGTDPIFYFDHKLKVLNNNIILSEFPFAGGIYSMANGENHWMSFQTLKGLNNHTGWFSKQGINRIYRKLRNYSFRFLTPRIQKEFSFHKL
ncbi:glycosyltransferase family 2 protein [Confluentibacter flavum]|uniref:Glycosyltransferase family 2 protein n=1 Tax=Confluentibacter flavum TaxID=1909700 RepID=A0A2N3HPD1_9FLAO|nr:glycosyltransferase family 2 protein [Confluentibacter flavum]PKQ46787.1 glycosyltransferase family 2 protein [Confluentibacter flavum]